MRKKKCLPALACHSTFTEIPHPGKVSVPGLEERDQLSRKAEIGGERLSIVDTEKKICEK